MKQFLQKAEFSLNLIKVVISIFKKIVIMVVFRGLNKIVD